jgi:hypothetical protein
MSEEQPPSEEQSVAPEKPKVVEIFSKEEYRPEPIGKKVDFNNPDPKTIAILESLLEQAHQGELSGLVFLSWNPVTKAFIREAALPEIEHVEERNAAALMLGGYMMFLDDLKDFAFWIKNYEPLPAPGDERDLNTLLDQDFDE